jgi:serine/threonine protein kinase
MIETMSRAAISRDWVGSFAAGRFPLLQWLGGSQATGVFLSEWSEHSQKAVIKLIPEDDQDAAARAAAWETAARLSHPNLMKVYTHGRCEIEGVPCIYVVTEYADEVLAEILRERPLSPDETRDMLGPALAALTYLHAKGLVHGRLNPSNIMAVGDNLKLTTYGVCPVGAAVISRPTRTVCDAPETENGLIVPASDIWSLGATLVEVLTKYPPDWNRAKAADPTVPQSMPEPFASFARRCLRSDPARRITISEITARLEPAKLSPDPVAKPAKTPPAKRRISLWFALTAVLLTAVGIWLSHREPNAPSQQAQTAPTATPTPSPTPTQVQSNPPTTSEEAPAPSQSTAPDSNSPPPQLQKPVTASAPVPAAAPSQQTPTQPQPQPQAEQTAAPTATTINPAIVNQILPDIVPSAMKTINGTLRVSVQLTVGADGSVTGATLQSTGPSKYFAGKSLEAARHWKFRPESAPSNWTLEFQYRQIGIHVVAEQTAL